MKTVLLGDVVAVRSSLVDPTDDKCKELPHIAPDTIERDTGRLLPYKTIGESGVQSGKYRFEAGDVIYSKIRPNLNKVTLVNFEGLCSADMYALQVDSTRMSATFLQHLLRSPLFVSYATNLSSRANIPKLNRLQLLRFPFDLPPLYEQRRISAILDCAAALEANRRQVEADLSSLDQAIFSETFGSPSEVLDRWPTKSLGDQLDFLTSGSRGWAKHYSSSGSAFLRIQNVGRNCLRLDDLARVDAPATAEARRTRVLAGDVLLSITADLGRTAVIPENIGTAYINQHLAILRCTSIDPHFLSTFLSSPVGQHQLLGRNRQGVKAGLNFDDIRSIAIAVPPIELQRQFSVVLSQVFRTRARCADAGEQEQALVASLQSRAFSGGL